MSRILRTGLLVSIIACLTVSSAATAHSGRTNSSGCHNNTKTGGYHCHNSGSGSGSLSSLFSKKDYADKFSTNEKKIKAGQKLLKKMDYYDGKKTGQLEDDTVQAIKDYQSANGLTESGRVTDKLLNHLHASYKAGHKAALKLTPIDPGKERIANVQAMLNDLGFDCGEVSGTTNAQTSAAVLDYQFSKDLELTGEINEELLDHLRTHVARN